MIRYIDLTDEIRNKIEGPQNVAKKLKRFDNKKMNGAETQDPNQTETQDCNDREFNNQTQSENFSSKLSSNQVDISDDDAEDELDSDEEIVLYEEETENESINSSLRSQEFISNSTDESILVGAANKSNQACCCNCHQNGIHTKSFRYNEKIRDDHNAKRRNFIRTYCDASTQTLSTGDIVITKIYLQNADERN